MGNDSNVRRHENRNYQNRRAYIHPAHGMKQELNTAIEITLRQIGLNQKLIDAGVKDAVRDGEALVQFEQTFREAVGFAKRYQFDKALSAARMARVQFQGLPNTITLMMSEVEDALDAFGQAQKDAVDRPPNDPKYQLTGVMLKIAREQEEAAQSLGLPAEDEPLTATEQVALYLDGSASCLRAASNLAREGKHTEAAGIAGCGTAVHLMTQVVKLMGSDVPEQFSWHLKTVQKFWTIQLKASGEYGMDDAYRDFPELRPASWQARRNAEKRGGRRSRNRKGRPQPQAKAS